MLSFCCIWVQVREHRRESSRTGGKRSDELCSQKVSKSGWLPLSVESKVPTRRRIGVWGRAMIYLICNSQYKLWIKIMKKSIYYGYLLLFFWLNRILLCPFFPSIQYWNYQEFFPFELLKLTIDKWHLSFPAPAYRRFTWVHPLALLQTLRPPAWGATNNFAFGARHNQEVSSRWGTLALQLLQEGYWSQYPSHLFSCSGSRGRLLSQDSV